MKTTITATFPPSLGLPSRKARLLFFAHLVIRRSLHALPSVPFHFSVCVCSTLYLFKCLSSVWVPRVLVSGTREKRFPRESTNLVSFYILPVIFDAYLWEMTNILATQNVTETFRFCIAHFRFTLPLHRKKKKKCYILCIVLYSAVLSLHTLYIYMYCEFPFHSCIFSLLDSSSSIFSISLTLFFFSFFSICFSFFLARPLFFAWISFSSFHSVNGGRTVEWPATEENEIPPNEKKSGSF